MPVAVAVAVGLINVGVGVNVLVGGRIVDVYVSAGVGVSVSVGAEVYAVSVAVVVSAGRVAATLDGMIIPVNKRPIALIPMKSLLDKYVVLARITMLLIATINFRKESPID